MSNSTKNMEWTVKRIQEGDYGCEERSAEERNQVIVTLENEDGTIRQLTADDDWLYETGIDEGHAGSPGEENVNGEPWNGTSSLRRGTHHLSE